MSEIKSTRTPFVIHGLAPEGVTVVTRAPTPWTATGTTLYAGDQLEITDAVYSLNVDREGYSWLDMTTDEQAAKWGRPKWGVGAVPEHVQAAVDAARVEKLRTEKSYLLAANPHLAKQSGASLRAAAIDAQIDRLSR